MVSLFAALVLAQSSPLATALRQEAFVVRPPEGFRMARMDLFHATQVGAVMPGGSTRYLAAALVDGDGEDAASLLFFVSDAPLMPGPSLRDVLSTRVVRHFNDELGQPFALERAEVVEGRVEVLGSIREGSQLRRVLVAAWPGEGRHVVAIASVPSGRWEALVKPLRASFATLRVEPPAPSRPPMRYVWAFAALMAALLLVSWGLWLRRRAAREE